MKISRRSAATAPVQRRKKHAKAGVPAPLQRGHLEAPKAAQRREQKMGAYKRVEVFLGVEAAIALRQLMRDGRSAREVIEALLLAEKQRRRDMHSAT